VRTWNRIRHMTMTAALLWLCVVTVTGQQPQAQYFKEDHLTGADYICLAADHSYHLTGREHMGVWVLESGRWEHSGDAIKFVPAHGRKGAYTGSRVSHKGHTFLAFSEDSAPGLAMSIDEIKRRIVADRKTLPSLQRQRCPPPGRFRQIPRPHPISSA
jgi:hypothetical protein